MKNRYEKPINFANRYVCDPLSKLSPFIFISGILCSVMTSSAWCQDDQAPSLWVASFNVYSHNNVTVMQEAKENTAPIDLSREDLGRQPPQRRLSNTQGWKARLNNFVKHVIVPYQSAVVGLQELYLRSDRCICKQCTDINRQQYLRHLLDTIESEP